VKQQNNAAQEEMCQYRLQSAYTLP